MFDRQKKVKKKKLPRQEWKPNIFLRIAYYIWRMGFGAFKIIVGALSTVLIIGAICAFVFVGVLGQYLQNDILPMADMDMTGYDMDQNSYMYYVDSKGNIQKYQDIFAASKSSWADLEDIPQDLIHAAVAIEDHRFFEHQGVDWITTIKACARMFFGDDSVGGSSITQQLIKNLLLTQDSSADDITVQRKVLEIFRAVQLEKRYGKDEIMEMYLNVIYLGQGCNGVRAAAATYYGKEVEMLTTAECASIISITNSPTFYDPYQNWDNNHERKENVLWAMREYGWLTEEEYQEAISQELKLKRGISFKNTMAYCEKAGCGYKGLVNTLTSKSSKYYCPDCGTRINVSEGKSQSVYSWFADTVLEDVAKALAEQNGMTWGTATKKLCMEQIQRGGYHIYTTIDVDVQKQVDKIYTNRSKIPKARSGQQLQSAIVVIDNSTGDIVAMSGGVGKKKDFDAWNRATDAKLQSGSSIKPLAIYAPGFETGTITPASVIRDLPLYYSGGKAWPRNDNYKYAYSHTILNGVVRSVNAVAANTLKEVGLKTGYDFAKNKFGLTTLVDEYVDSAGTVHTDAAYAPLAMGAQTFGVTVRDMASAYATFANNGIYREDRTFTKVYDSDGNIVIDNVQEKERILSKKATAYMNYCLVKATKSGTGTGAYFSGTQLAGKTGSTADFKDRWYCGYTGYYTAAVWTGFDKPEVIRGIYGNPASQIFKKVMQPLHKGLKNKKLYTSSKFKTVSVCLDSGKLATSACRADARGVSRIATSVVYAEDYPTKYCTDHVSVKLCSSGGTPTEWCEKFAAVKSSVTIKTRSYVKMTKDEYNHAAKAVGKGLSGAYVKKSAILIGGSASNEKCKEHTKETWEAYLANQATEAPNPGEETTAPTTPASDTPVA